MLKLLKLLELLRPPRKDFLFSIWLRLLLVYLTLSSGMRR